MVTEDKQYFIPMETTVEFALAHGYKREDFRYWKVGNRTVWAILVPVSKEEYYEFMRPLWREIKREDRKKQYFEENNLTEVSLDYMNDEFEFNIPSPTDLEDEVEKILLLEMLKEDLAKLEELERKIMDDFLDGKTESETGKAIGMSQKGVNKRKTKVMKRLKEKYKK